MLLLSALVVISLLPSSTAQFGVYFTQNQDMFVSYSSWLVPDESEAGAYCGGDGGAPFEDESVVRS